MIPEHQDCGVPAQPPVGWADGVQTLDDQWVNAGWATDAADFTATDLRPGQDMPIVLGVNFRCMHTDSYTQRYVHVVILFVIVDVVLSQEIWEDMHLVLNNKRHASLPI